MKKHHIFLLIAVFAVASSCYKEHCYECFQDTYTNKEAVYNSIEQNYVTGEWHYTLGQSPFRFSEEHRTVLCDPWAVESYENGSGQFGTRDIDTIFGGHPFTMQYNTYRIVSCRIIK